MKLKNIYKISKWETLQSTPSFTLRSVVLVLLLFGVLFGAAMIGGTQSVAPSDNIYTIGVDQDSDYYAPVEASQSLRIVEPDRTAFNNGNIDVLISDGTVHVANTEKGNAALTELQQVVGLWNDAQLQHEENQAAAFPLTVNIQYVDQTVTGSEYITDDETDANSDGESDDSSDDSIMDSLLPSFGSSQDVSSPTQISPPFPFQSVVFALLFLIPLNFVAQAFASNIMKERINRRGELLLVTPVSSGDIIAGKTIPYFLLMVVIVGLISWLTGGGIIGVLAMIPIIITFLGAVFIAALISRSYKELTFVTVTISVGLIAYAFIPAIFTDIHPIALVSPLSLVVMSIDGTPITMVEFLFSAVPLTLTGVLLFAYGAGLYNEEDLFTQKPLHKKFLDGLTTWTPNVWAVPFITAAFLPFVFAAQLIILASLFPLPPEVALIILFFMVAVIEEIAKSIHIYAGFKNNIFDNTFKTAIIAGGLSGIGFFVAEKITVVTQYVGLQQMDIGQAAFGADLSTGSPFMALISLAFPLLLHMGTATLSSIGARKGFKKYMLWMGVAIAVHMVYNLTIIMTFVL